MTKLAPKLLMYSTFICLTSFVTFPKSDIKKDNLTESQKKIDSKETESYDYWAKSYGFPTKSCIEGGFGRSRLCN